MERVGNAGGKAKISTGIRAKAKAEPGTTKTPAPPRHLNFLHLKVTLDDGTRYLDELGHWDVRESLIQYDGTANKQVIKETILHETLHVIFEHTGVNQDQHEEIICAISPLILHVIRENPELISYLASD